MLKLWGRKTSSNVMKVLWTLDELGLPYSRVDVGGAFGGTATDEYRAKQPMGLVPAIEEPDGFTLFESNAIIKYLCNAHAPTSRLYPNSPRGRGQVDAWMDLQQTALSAPAGTFFIGLVRTPPEQRDMAAIEAAILQANGIYGIVDRALAGRSFICGEQITLADIAWGVHVHRWFVLDLPGRVELPNLRAWYNRLLARPPYATHCAQTPV